MVSLTSLARLTTFLDASNVHSTPSPIFSPTLRTALPMLDDENVSGSMWMLKLSSDSFGQPDWLMMLKSNGLTLYVLRLFRNCGSKMGDSLSSSSWNGSRPERAEDGMKSQNSFILCQRRCGPSLWYVTGWLHFGDGQSVVFGTWRFRRMSCSRSWTRWSHYHRPRSAGNWRAFCPATPALARSIGPCSCIHASTASAQGQSAVIPAQWSTRPAPRHV